jgi:hypothetical protein
MLPSVLLLDGNMNAQRGAKSGAAHARVKTCGLLNWEWLALKEYEASNLASKILFSGLARVGYWGFRDVSDDNKLVKIGVNLDPIE